MYQSTIPQFIKMLGNLSAMIDKAAKFADAKKFDVSNLLVARLAPDMFHFTKQVQVACDMAKGCAARIANKEAPKFEDNEKTIDDLRYRIQKTVTFLKSIKAEECEGAETRPIKIKEGKFLPGLEYVVETGLPNFYFHVTTAYAILRHNGVDLGKADFLGPINYRDKI